MTAMQLAVVDVVDVAGPPSHAVAAVEGWAQTIASPSTRRSYRAAVRAPLREHGEITPKSVAAWRDEMAEKGLERATIRQRIAAVRAFAAWAARMGVLPAELVVALSAVQPPRLAGQHAPVALHEPQLRLMDRRRRRLDRRPAAHGTGPRRPARARRLRPARRRARRRGARRSRPGASHRG